MHTIRAGRVIYAPKSRWTQQAPPALQTRRPASSRVVHRCHALLSNHSSSSESGPAAVAVSCTAQPTFWPSQLRFSAPWQAATAPASRASRGDGLVVQAVTGGGDGGAGGGSGGGFGSGGGGGSNGPGDGKGDGEEEDKVLTLTEAQAFAATQRISLPADMLEIAQKYGLRASALSAYAAIQGSAFTRLVSRVPYLRDRMIADKLFLFKIGAEIVIDSACATVAEVRKRGEDFWAEFEFYLSDLLVGLVLDVALVSLMAPVAVIGGVSRAAMSTGINKWLAGIPSAVLEAGIPGVKEFTLGARAACIPVKFLEYSLAGITCGFLGQGFANSLMLLKRQLQGESESDVTIPPLLKTALVWGLFMGVSSNLRYQVVFGLERAVDATIARKIPQVAYGTTIAIRFINNVIGGENFIDMARWAGVQ